MDEEVRTVPEGNDEKPQDTDTPDSDQHLKDYVQNIAPLQKQKKLKRTVAIVLVTLLAIAAAAGGYVIVKLSPPTTTPRPNQPASQTEEQKAVLIGPDTKTHESNQFFLSFSYPADWTVEEVKGTGLLTVTSPELELPTEGSTTRGKVVFSIRAKSQKLPEFDDGNALAVIDSEKISYANPTQAQRGETHLSFLNFASSTNHSLIDGVYITGDFGYKKDQAIPKIDIQKIDNVYAVKFVSCDGSCELPVGLPVSSWKQADFGQAIKKIFQSLRVN